MRKIITATAASAIALAAAAPARAVAYGRKDAPDLEALLEGHTKSVEEAVGGVKQKTAELDERMSTIEQKAARGGGSGGLFGSDQAKTWGAQVAEADELRHFREARSKTAVRISLKTITSADDSAGATGRPAYVDAATMIPRRRLRVRDLLSVIKVETGTVEFPQQTTRTNAAATVAEGALKPQSDLAWDMVPVPIRTIAHWVLASRQVLDDAPQLQGMIDGELRYGLGLIEENELLLGAGTGTDLDGIYPQATAFAAPFDPVDDVQEIDVIGLALLQADNTLLPADGIVLHPTDWMRMRLLKDTQGKYILGDPQSPIDPVLFGRPVVPTPAIAAGTFLVGAFKQGATLYDRMEAEVLLSTEDSDNFRKNLVTILAEERIGLAVKQPASFIKGTFATIITALNA